MARLLALALVALSTSVTAVAAPKLKSAPVKPDPVVVAHERIRDALKDPESARFKGDFAGKDGAICGYVNSKNSYGGYDGFQRYIVRSDNVLIEYDASRTWIVDTRWAEFCSDFEPRS